MIGSLIQSFLWFSESFFLTILILIFGHTWNLHFKGWGSIIKHNKSVFYAFWHENMLPVLLATGFSGGIHKKGEGRLQKN
jgi:hypothetical protein